MARFKKRYNGGSKRGILSRIFGMAKSPAGMILIAVSILLPFLVKPVGDMAQNVVSKIKKD